MTGPNKRRHPLVGLTAALVVGDHRSGSIAERIAARSGPTAQRRVSGIELHE